MQTSSLKVLYSECLEGLLERAFPIVVHPDRCRQHNTADPRRPGMLYVAFSEIERDHVERKNRFDDYPFGRHRRSGSERYAACPAARAEGYSDHRYYTDRSRRTVWPRLHLRTIINALLSRPIESAPHEGSSDATAPCHSGSDGSARSRMARRSC